MKNKRYFRSLHGVRCIASFMVLFHHLEQAKHSFGVPNIYTSSIIQHTGRLGVGLFFVLSGFLITYLLLEERGNYNHIDTGKFYMRRFVRIWPIYFLILILSLFVFPFSDLLYFPETNAKLENFVFERMALLALVLPNFAFVLTDLPYWCAQTWSIGVEEQFYYLWPWLIKYTKWKFVIFFSFMAILITMLFVGIYLVHPDNSQTNQVIATFIGQFRIQIMALGGLVAWLVYYDKQSILQFLYRRDFQYAVYVTFVILFLSGIHFTGFMEIYALFFAIFIVNVSSNPHSIINVENPVMNYLGRISYGIYIYHVFVTVLSINTLRIYFPDLSGLPYQLLLYSSCVILSIMVSEISFRYLEKPLLNYKDKVWGR